tara:strand:- start:2381 stop:3136 length:756 start_codon:yes stop_codon:yes gene_type:complete
MMKKIIYLFVVLNTSLLFSQDKEEILFVGNSFTFYWNLPSVVQQMSDERNLNWNVTQSTAGGATLKEHWLGEKDLKTKKLIERNSYSKIIFQDHSMNPIIAIDSTKKYYTQFKDLIPSSTKTYFYSTWMYPKIDDPNRDLLKRNTIEKNIINSGINKSSMLLLVGRAFDRFRSKYPEYKLLGDDMKHQSANGTYLAACVIFSSLSNQSSKGLKFRYSGKDDNGKKIYYILTNGGVDEKCQEIADLIVFNNE